MMYRPSNTVTERLKKLFKRRIADGEIAYLGDSILPGARVDVPGRPGYVYVRFPYGRDANGYTLFTPPTMARSSGAAFTNYPGTAVYVAVKYNNELEIVSAHYPSMDRAGINTATLNPLNQQSKFVYPWQLTYGLANAVSTAATSSALVTVKSFLHYVGNVFQTFQTPLEADKPDLSAYIPGTDEHRLVAIWVDTYTNTAEVTTSVTQPLSEAFNSTDIQELAAGRPPDAMPLKAFVLANGQVKVAQDPSKETDIRQHMAAPHIWGFPNVLTTRERVRPNRTLVTGPYTLSGAGDMAYEAGARHIIVHKNNFVGMAAPDADNDESEDYSVGSLWYDISTGLLYVAEDVTEGAAVWNVVESSAVGMTSFGVEGDSGDPFDIEEADTLTFQGANGIVVSTDDATTTVIIDGSGVVSLPTSLDLLNQTAGESWSIRDNLYFKMSSASWFKIDNNAIPIAVGTLRGVATAAATGGSADNTIRVKGLMTGYSGLTPGLPLYASGTAGGYTQTKPTLTAGGGQIAICEMGTALSASSAWIDPKPVEFHKRESLVNTATLSITHYEDAQGRSRTTRAYIASSTTVLLETYATSNRDAAIQLKGQSGAGSTTTPDSVGAAAYQLGDQGGSEYRVAQSFTVTSAGILTSATIFAAANAGSPTGFPTVSVRLDDGTGKPSTTSLDSVALSSWTPSATNTITFTGGVFLSTGVTYWLVAEAPPQATGVTFAINRNTGNPYANGQFKADANLANTWTAFAGATNDMRCSITVSAIVLNDAVAQGFSHASSTDVLYIDLDLKRTGTRTGDLTLEIQSNSGGLPSGTPITNGVSATVPASSVDTSWELVRFTFSSPAITSGVQYHAVLKTTDTASNTAYIEVGTDASSPGYSNGAVALLQSSSWGAASPAADMCFDIYGVGTYYDQPVLVGLGSPVLNVWYGDASYADQDTTTTFKNVYGVTIDVVSIVEME